MTTRILIALLGSALFLAGCPKAVVVTPPAPAPTAHNVLLSWSTIPTATSYVVDRDGTALERIQAPATTYMDPGLLAGSHVYLVIACIDAENLCSPPSNSETAVIP